MNSDIELVSYAPEAERRLARAQRWLAAFEARFSRFRELSELNRLNASAGRPFVASPLMFELAEKALELARRSAGLFDPALLRELIEAGYDRSFELLSRGSASDNASRHRDTSWRDVKLDRRERTITLPEGLGIDLGGMGKGYAVDRLAAMLGTPALVNGGGDVYASGHPHDAAAWLVGVEDPFSQERDLAILAVRDRGIATSSTLRRRWRQNGVWQHHLIDPRSRRPSTSDAVQVTVVARSALDAEFQAKVALLLGVSDGLSYLNGEADVEGIVASADGRVLASSGLETYLADPAPPSRASG
jgi:thiamine biosynthesis lipoprotein